MTTDGERVRELEKENIRIRSILERTTEEMHEVQARSKKNEADLKYFKKIARDSGMFSMGALCLGAVVTMKIDNLKEFFVKAILRLFP